MCKTIALKHVFFLKQFNLGLVEGLAMQDPTDRHDCSSSWLTVKQLHSTASVTQSASHFLNTGATAHMHMFYDKFWEEEKNQ